jgi:ArsR family transcriptional regulator, arsenate/arsenite/antimonite-responsive transcriptional repressor
MPVNDTVRLFKALADPTRLRVLLLLQVRELCVCELTYILGLEQSRVSHHMRILREAGLVDDLRQGRWMIYRIPARSRGFIDGLFAGLGRARLGSPVRRAGDARKLEDCVRENVRSRRGSGRPGRSRGPRPQTKERSHG